MTIEELDQLNIFALRDLARRTGVNSPTSKKKDVLISEIIEIVSGKKTPQAIKSKQGRPPKVFGYGFANVFSNENFVVDLSKQTLNQNVEIDDGSDVVTIAGWLEMVNNNSALLWVEKNFRNENYFVPSEVLANLNTKMGDRVVAEISTDVNSKVVKKIFSVNDYPVSSMQAKRNAYENIEHIMLNEILDFENEEYKNLNISKGENVYVYGTNNNENTKKIIDMLNSCKIENKIYINVSVVEKNKIFLKKLNYTENFVSNITDTSDVSKRVVMLAIERAKRVLEFDENVLIVVDDISSVMGVDESLVRSLVSVTKSSNKGSITLLAVMPNHGMSQIEKLADKRLEVIDEKIKKI